MDVMKYKKIILQENWGENKFSMIEESVNVPQCFPYTYSVDFQKSYPKILSGEAFWITHNKICVGYYYRINPDIFRPIFSYKRQDLLNMVHIDIVNAKKFWNNIKSRYYLELSKISNLPLECVGYIVTFMY